MWKQPVPAEQFHNTSSRRWIWRQNQHSNWLKTQLAEGADWNIRVQPACVWQENPPDQIPGHDTSLQPNQFQVGRELVLVIPHCYPAGSASSRQSFWEPLLSPSLLLWEEASNWPWREAVVQRQEGPEKHLILINKKGTFNSCLSFWCWGRISCIQADVWPWRCCSVGHSQAAWRTWGSPSWCLSFKQKVFKWKERVGRQIKKALTN